MEIRARVENSAGRHRATVSTNEHARTIEIDPKPEGLGSSVNGGELLFLALATCACNDVYREAARRGIRVHAVDVDVRGRFAGEGESARDIVYRVALRAEGDAEELRELVRQVDRVTEIQNTLRAGVAVTLGDIEVAVERA